MVLVISGEGLYFDSAANGQKGTEETYDRKKAGRIRRKASLTNKRN